MDRRIYSFKSISVVVFVVVDAFLIAVLWNSIGVTSLLLKDELPDQHPEVSYTTNTELSADSANTSTAAESTVPTEVAEPRTSLLAVGDIMLSRDVGNKIVRNSVDYPFEQMRDVLSAADITFGNLENPIYGTRPYAAMDQLIFNAAVGTDQALARAGFDVLSVANNHSTNFGVAGLESTMELLRTAGVAFAGVGNETDAHTAAVIKRNGITFAFLAYTDGRLIGGRGGATQDQIGIAFMDIDRMKQDVAAAKLASDVVIVSMHAGTEYTETLTSTQTDFAHAAIDAGAEVVIGTHPHVVQRVEEYNGGTILYSLGNYIFDQQFSYDTSHSVMATLHFVGARLGSVSFLPISIDSSYQPKVMSLADGSSTLARLGDGLRTLGTVSWDESRGIYTMDTIAEIAIPATAADTAAPEKSDRDPESPYTYMLQDGVLTVNKNGTQFWQSDTAWYVDSYAVGNSTGDTAHDGAQQLTLSVWKAGNFGSSKPFWVTENDPSVKNHFFVFKFGDTTLEPVWQSSNLEKPNCNYVLHDVDNDGQDELVVTEGEYGVGRTCTATHVAVWKWNEWGFANEWRSDAGNYGNMHENGATVSVDARPE